MSDPVPSSAIYDASAAGLSMLTAADAAAQRSLMSVYSTSQVDAIIGGLTFLTSSQIDTLAEINAILGDADLVAQSRTITAGTGLSGGGDLSSDRTINLANTAVAAGSYTSANITVDAQGRITAAASGSAASPGGSSGQMQFNNAGAFGGAAQVVYATTVAHVTVSASGATLVPVVCKGAASQTGNLQEWQNSSGTVLASVTSAGHFFGSQLRSSTSATTSMVVVSEGLRKRWELSGAEQNQYITPGCAFDGGTSWIFLGSGGAPSYAPGVSTHVLSLDCANRVIYLGTTGLSSPSAYTLAGSGATGSNVAGGKITVAAGRSTGNATPAVVAIATGTAGSSGATLQTLRDGLQVDGNATSGETPLLLLDITAGTLKRVSIGASDSGGTGFKVLRVPN